MKKIIILVVWFVSFSCFANPLSCPSALSTTDPGFCNSFAAAASCYCAKTLPQSMCMNINIIYQRMIAMFGSVENACRFQTETSTQICIDDWHCYLNGGKNSQGGLCSSSGKACV